MLMITHSMLSRREAARALGVHPATLDRWRKRRGGPPWHEIGSRYLYAQDDLDAWVASQKRTPAAPRPERLVSGDA